MQDIIVPEDMSNIKTFEDLEIWQLSRALCQDIFVIIEETPLKNNFRLANQIDGAPGSIMDNIAEGFERNGNREFLQFLSVAKASCGEVRSQLYRLKDRNFVNDKTFEDLKNKTLLLSKKISAFIKYLKNSEMSGTKFK
ncbi:four helix bundle protein [Riemerella anatipestifer]|uniref:four helix bundle protein n=1 Tax=Riemerella anatipestifer TaxID=34085 RepID=UPI002265C79C|nr:four helix bundle protein [Riemerella anatipestifer]UZX28714.1 four helix bundle protein [Riemerella anatipestifer]